MLLKVQKMSQELPFKSIKITLSQEALDRLDKIVKEASFRSFSSGVEESIRAFSDVLEEVKTVIGDEDEEDKAATDEQEARAFERIGMRVSRFTGRVLFNKK